MFLFKPPPTKFHAANNWLFFRFNSIETLAYFSQEASIVKTSTLIGFLVADAKAMSTIIIIFHSYVSDMNPYEYYHWCNFCVKVRNPIFCLQIYCDKTNQQVSFKEVCLTNRFAPGWYFVILNKLLKYSMEFIVSYTNVSVVYSNYY